MRLAVGGARSAPGPRPVRADLRPLAGAQLQRLGVVGDEHPAAVRGDADRHHVVPVAVERPQDAGRRAAADRRARWSGRRRRPRPGSGPRSPLAHSASAFRARDSSRRPISAGDAPSWTTATTFSMIGTSTPCCWASPRIDVHDFTPSAVVLGRGDDLGHGHPLAEALAEGPVARQRRHARGDQVTDAGQARGRSAGRRPAPSPAGPSRPGRG